MVVWVFFFLFMSTFFVGLKSNSSIFQIFSSISFKFGFLWLKSVIIPIYNGEAWLNDCLDSILKQDILKKKKIEISVYNDSSTDNTAKLLTEWKKKVMNTSNLSLIVSDGNGKAPKGVGYGKNQAIQQSQGKYLCFQDIDDIMMPRRISAQLEEAEKYPNGIIGCQVKRIPEDSTPRLSAWANFLPQNLLTTQIYTSHGPTVLMPTWFFHRSVYDKAGKFSEEGKGTPEDLLFFYSHLDAGGTVRRVDEVLLIYRYHPNCTTFSISEDTIWDIRLDHFEKCVLPKWTTFTIWNAGKQGRKFYRSLRPWNRRKVVQFCDVDPKKVNKFYEPYFRGRTEENGKKIPIVHFTKAKPPFVTCVKLDLTKGQFEENLNSLNLIEGKDFFIFS